jgi:putative transposase
MSRKRYPPEQIIGMLREAEVALAQGLTVGQVCRTLGIAEQTFYRWRREYGGLKVERVYIRSNSLITPSRWRSPS